MRQRKQVWTTLPGGRIKRVQGRHRGEGRDRFGRADREGARRNERRTFRQSFRSEWRA